MKHHYPDWDKVQTAYSYLTTLHHPRRMRIIDLLKDYGYMTVPQVATHLNLDSEQVKGHLKNLKLAGVVNQSIEEKTAIYSLNEQKLKAVHDFIKCLT